MKKRIAIVAILILLFFGFSIAFYLINKKTKNKKTKQNIEVMIVKEDLHFFARKTSAGKESTPFFNLFLRTNIEIKWSDIRNIEFPEIDSKIKIMAPKGDKQEKYGNYYFFGFHVQFEELKNEEEKISIIKFNLFEKEYERSIGIRIFKILSDDEYEEKSVMFGPMDYRTYKAVTGSNKRYTINLGNKESDVFEIKEISLINEKLKIENITFDNQKNGVFVIKPGNVCKIDIEFSFDDDFVFFVVQPKIKFTYKGNNYEQFCPQAYVGYLDYGDTLIKWLDKNENKS